MRTDKGFTLIELLIVIAILSILASMALPSYQDRVIRTQVAEAMTVAEVAQDAVAGYYKTKGRLPKNNTEAGLPKPGKFVGNFVKSIDVRDGGVNITLGNRVNKHIEGKVLSIRPAIVRDAPIVPVAWVCGNATVPKGMTVLSKNLSTIISRHMPVECRY